MPPGRTLADMQEELARLEAFRPTRFQEKNWPRIRKLEKLIAAKKSSRAPAPPARAPVRKKPRVPIARPGAEAGGTIRAPSVPQTKEEMEASARLRRATEPWQTWCPLP